MPKGFKAFINLDLLHPQSEPQKLVVKAIHWALSAGRFIVVFVEILVLAAFVARFKFDADIQATKEAIDQQLPFIQSLKADEQLIRQTQFQLLSIKDIKNNSPDYIGILKRISDQASIGLILQNLNLEKRPGKVLIKITGTAVTNNDLSTFILGLKQDKSFSDINLASISLDQGVINFSVTGSTTLSSPGDKIQ